MKKNLFIKYILITITIISFNIFHAANSENTDKLYEKN